MPNGAHGCFVDYQGNLWVGGNGDGIVQKYNPKTAAAQGAQATAVLQLGKKDMCDTTDKTCNATTADNKPNLAQNTSHELLYFPPDIAVDPDVGPITKTRGDIYVADGYGNYRVVVFNAAGQYVGQWGQSCGHNENPDGSNACPEGTFGAAGGGHPHCVVLGSDGLVYVCDRPNNRIQVFKKTCAQPSVGGSQPLCKPDRVIRIDRFPGATMANKTAILRAGTRSCDLDFWPSKDALVSGSQNFILNVDLGNDNTWVIDKGSGDTVAAVGRCGQAPCPGHNAAEFAFGHTVNVGPDNKTVYVSETITGRRIQRFVKVDDDNGDEDD
jgi:DNA-binding beta-propeller fold protein YncE